jgi:hypothetical protein
MNPSASADGLDQVHPVDVDFTCEEVVADRFAAGPTVVFKMRCSETSGVRVHAVALRCQVRVEPVRRSYSDAEAAQVVDLFGERSRWGTTMQTMQLAFMAQVLPGFEGSTTFDLTMPCSYDVEVAAHKYLAGLEDGHVPLLMLFSGTIFTGSPGTISVMPVPWHKEAVVRMPVSVWREAMDAHFPGQAWLRLDRQTYERLSAYRGSRGLVGWDATVAALLEGAGE